jgi:hypothetical protein
MKGKQLIFLLIALVLPGCVFVFLKIFGKNEFAVEPLYSAVAPEVPAGCSPVTVPYYVPDSIVKQLNFRQDSLSADKAGLVLVMLGDLSADGITQLKRVDEEYNTDPVHQTVIGGSDPRMSSWKKCIFFLKEPFDLVLVDRKGALRGQYNSNDREDVDRLLTEITIILKKY